jgi:hypothetical protein
MTNKQAMAKALVDLELHLKPNYTVIVKKHRVGRYALLRCH